MWWDVVAILSGGCTSAAKTRAGPVLGGEEQASAVGSRWQWCTVVGMVPADRVVAAASQASHVHGALTQQVSLARSLVC